MRAANDQNAIGRYRADLRLLAGKSVYLFSSGVLGGTPAFGLFAALPNGTVVELPATPVARVQVIHNSPNPTVDVWANDDLLIDNFVYRTATPFIFVPAGVDIDGVSQNPTAAIFTMRIHAFFTVGTSSA